MFSLNVFKTKEKRMKTLSILLIPVTMSLILSGCKMITNMDEMHDATLGMEGVTKGMSETTNKMYDGMNETKYISKQMLLGMRPKEARDTRDKQWNYLLSSNTMSEKLDAAAAYNYAMEFQGFEPRFEDEVERQGLYKQGIEELVQKVRALAKNRNKTGATAKSDHMENLYALGAQLHKISHHQTVKSKEWGFKPMSTYDVIVEGLKNDWAIGQNQASSDAYDTDTSTTIASRWKEDMVYLLRLRANFLTAYVYVMMAADVNGDEPSFMSKAWTLIKTNLFKKSWSTNLNYRTTKQIQYYNYILNLALTTRYDLMDMAYSPMIDKKVIGIMSHIDFSDVDSALDPSKGNSQSIAEKRKAVEELKATIAKIVNTGA